MVWIDGSGLKSAPDRLARLAGELEAAGSRCLLVLDDVADVGELLPFLAQAGPDRAVIITTEAPDVIPEDSIAVGSFSAAEGLAYLHARTGLDDEPGARLIGEALGWLPLSLAQAGAVIAERRLTYRGYLDQLRAIRPCEVLRSKTGEPYPPGAAEAILLSLDALAAADPFGASRVILDSLAMLSQAGVPPLYLQGRLDWGGNGGRPGGQRRADARFRQLENWPLVTPQLDGARVSAHRLTMRVIREQRLADGSFSDVTDLAGRQLIAVLSRFPLREVAPEVVEQIVALHQHTRGRLDGKAESRIQELRERAVHMVNELGDDPALAIRIGEPLVSEVDGKPGASPELAVSAWYELGRAYLRAGRTDDGLVLLLAALTKCQRTLQPDHPVALHVRRDLVLAYEEAGRPDQAIRISQQALTDLEQGAGFSTDNAIRFYQAVLARLSGTSDGPEASVRALNADAERLIEAGQLDAARPLLDQALGIARDQLGRDHPGTLTTRSYMARWLGETGQIQEAEAESRRLADDCRRILGPSHAETLMARGNAAVWLGKGGQAQLALTETRQLLEDCRRLLAPDHPVTLTCRNHLANFLGQTGLVRKAAAEFRRSLDDHVRVLGPEHPDTLRTRLLRASCLGAAGKVQQAVTQLQELLEDCLRIDNRSRSAADRAHPKRAGILAGDRGRAATKATVAAPERHPCDRFECSQTSATARASPCSAVIACALPKLADSG